jgi:hypothetical protein
LVDFELAEPESFELKGCNVGEMQEGDLLDVATVRYFWDNSTPLNCKEVTNSLIRQFKTDYFLAVLAGSKVL